MRSSHRSRPIGLPRQRSCLHKSKPRTKPNTSSPPTTTFNPVPHPLRRDQIRRQAQTVNIIEIQFGTAEANRGEHRIVLAEQTGWFSRVRWDGTAAGSSLPSELKPKRDLFQGKLKCERGRIGAIAAQSDRRAVGDDPVGAGRLEFGLNRGAWKSDDPRASGFAGADPGRSIFDHHTSAWVDAQDASSLKVGLGMGLALHHVCRSDKTCRRRQACCPQSTFRQGTRARGDDRPALARQGGQ